MKHRIRFTKVGLAQVDRASNWWRKHRDKVSNAVDEDVDEAIEVLRATPHVGMLVRAHRSTVRALGSSESVTFSITASATTGQSKSCGSGMPPAARDRDSDHFRAPTLTENPRYDSRMTIVTGRVVNGRIEVEDVELPEGMEVSVYYSGDEPEVQLSAEELAELDASIAEADRGELIPAEEVLRELRAMTDEFVNRRP